MARTKRVIAAAAVGIVAASSLVACGDGKKSSSGGSKETVILGTTDRKIATLDPAGAYDMQSWTVFWNTFQTLLWLPPGSTTPSPDAAQKCDWADPKTFTCTLKDGLTFSDGSPLTSADVKHSFDRMIAINDPNGPATLLETLDKTEAPDPKTVTFKLKTEDSTFPYRLTTGAGMIVSAKAYPADKLIAEQGKIVGSGPYKLDSFKAEEVAAFSANSAYKGDAQMANKKFVVQYFSDPSGLKQAIEKGTVDVALKDLSPTDIKDLRTKESSAGLKVIDGEGTAIRYVMFNVKVDPAQQKAVRQAVAQVVDREAIAKNVYNDTVTPTYSMIPKGVGGHTEAFKDKYGTPSKEKAKALLDAAGVTGKVKLTLWYTPTHYGASTADEYTELKRQLEESGLFTVDLQSTEWEQYQKDYKDQKYPAFGLGWFPDFPDADNYTAPFFLKGGYTKSNYDVPAMNDLIVKEQAMTDRAQTAATFAEIQKLTAEDVPALPMWQAKQIAVVRNGITGLEKTLDPTYVIRFWLVAKGQ